MFLKIAVFVVVTLVLLIAFVLVVGYALPKDHFASRSVRIRQRPEDVWSTIHDVDRFATWRAGLKKVERLPDADGHARWKEESTNGVITYEMMEASPPSKLVTRIADPTLPFGGSWTFLVEPIPEGSTITISERGEVRNPIFRFVSRFVLGYTGGIDQYLRSLGKKFGEDVQPRQA